MVTYRPLPHAVFPMLTQILQRESNFYSRSGLKHDRDMKGGSQDVLGSLYPPKTERTRLDCLRSQGQFQATLDITVKHHDHLWQKYHLVKCIGLFLHRKEIRNATKSRVHSFFVVFSQITPVIACKPVLKSKCGLISRMSLTTFEYDISCIQLSYQLTPFKLASKSFCLSKYSTTLVCPPRTANAMGGNAFCKQKENGRKNMKLRHNQLLSQEIKLTSLKALTSALFSTNACTISNLPRPEASARGVI